VNTQLTEFRSGIYEKLGLVIGELKAMREEQAITGHRLISHEED